MITITTAANPRPIPERSHLTTSDPDEAGEFLEAAYGVRLRLSQTVAARRSGPVLAHTRTDVGPFSIDELRIAGEVTAAPDPLEKVMAAWATRGRLTGECGGISGRAGAGEITLTSQHDQPYEAHTQDLTVTAVLMDPALVAGVAAGTPAGQAPLPIRFSAFQPVDAGASRLWKATVSYVKNSVLADDVTATPLVIGHAGRLLAAATLSAFPSTAGCGPAPYDRTDHQPVLLRRAIEFMDANVGTDISLAAIAQSVHVSPRAVQYMFRRHLEITPLQYLRRLRLQYAHRDLLAANRLDATVTGIAARWGFAHTGRFAVLYRDTYGQSPHAALRS